MEIKIMVKTSFFFKFLLLFTFGKYLNIFLGVWLLQVPAWTNLIYS